MNIPPNSKLLFIGDSITDAGRGAAGEAAAWEPQFGLGQGYVSMIYAWLGAVHPEAAIRVVNKGTSGHTVRDLAGRWETDVIAEKPETLCVMIGINDVWRQFDLPRMPEIHVGPAEYAATLDELVAKTKPLVKGLVLMTPYYLEPNPRDAMRARMDEYGRLVKKIADKHDVVFVDTQAAFGKVLKYIYPATLGWDRVHPTAVGHMVLARAFLAGVGFKG